MTSKPAEQSAEQRAARSVLFGDVSACQPNAEIRLSGELATDTVGDLGAQLTALIRTGHRQLLVDGRGLSRVSPVCVEVFNRAASWLLRLGGQLILTGLNNTDADRLRSAGLHGAIRVTQAPVRGHLAHRIGNVFQPLPQPTSNASMQQCTPMRCCNVPNLANPVA